MDKLEEVNAGDRVTISYISRGTRATFTGFIEDIKYYDRIFQEDENSSGWEINMPGQLICVFNNEHATVTNHSSGREEW